MKSIITKVKDEKAVLILGKEPRVSSISISIFVDLAHKFVVNLINSHEEDFLEFGELKKEIGHYHKLKADGEPFKAGRKDIVIWLNEPQATLLLTMMRNSPVVVNFKKKLIREFFSISSQLKNLKNHKLKDHYVDKRKIGIEDRKEQTLAIKNFIEYAKGQGSKSADKYYVAITKMENSILFRFSDRFDNLREFLTIEQLKIMSTADRILRKTLEDGMKAKLYYKDIFKLCKDKLAKYIEIEGGQTDIISEALAEADALLLEKE